MPRTCYACEAEETSVEHIPPRCLFPEQKDLPDGVDLRKQLLTVPSCEEHNSLKSNDDEYLLFALVSNIPNNKIATNHFLTKVMRAVAKFPGKFDHFLTDVVPVVVEDTETGEIQHTAGLSVDFDRIVNSLELMSRALYFAHFKRKWAGRVRAFPNFILAVREENASEINEPYAIIAASAREMLKGEPQHGMNPEVFNYRVFENKEGSIDVILQMQFYGGCLVTVLYGG